MNPQENAVIPPPDTPKEAGISSPTSAVNATAPTQGMDGMHTTTVDAVRNPKTF
jgi:hypothetical protein